nr:LLM class flavin-dependent oxidoreductase [Dehalococcoidia bacterium]
MDRIGVGFSGGMSPQDIVECVKVAEELGYESAWVAEGHGGDQFSVLTACAMVTERIKLGTSITSVFVRTPPTIAMAAASVDYFSNGRFILGVGSSHKVQVEPEHGLEFTRPVQRLRECVDIIRAILKDSDVNYHGEIYDIDRFDLWFQPLRKEIPIYVAAVFPKMLEICGEISEGAILTWCTLAHAEEAAQAVGLGARNAGRNPDDVEVASLLPCAVSDDRETARDLMRMPIASYAGRFPVGGHGAGEQASDFNIVGVASGVAGAKTHGLGGFFGVGEGAPGEYRPLADLAADLQHLGEHG